MAKRTRRGSAAIGKALVVLAIFLGAVTIVAAVFFQHTSVETRVRGTVEGESSEVIWGPVSLQDSQRLNTVAVSPSDVLSQKVAAAPAGTTFLLAAGVHRMQTVTPKDGQTFLGEKGAILSGARLLTDFTKEGNVWVIGNQTQEGRRNGSCSTEFPRCAYPEDVFINNTALVHVASRELVAPGTYYFDYTADKIYLGDDPTGKTVEVSVIPAAFTGTAANVSIVNLIVEKFASPGQKGAIDASRGTNWKVDQSLVRDNHSSGITLGERMQVLRTQVLHNGQQGIHGSGSDILIQHTEIAFNNFAGYSSGWEAGGTKFAKTTRLTVRENYVHDNNGPGLWTDINNIQTLYEGNVVTKNRNAGIFHEISYDAVIRNNYVADNGITSFPWLYGAQILISTSSNVEVYGNTVIVHEKGGNGITIIQQERGTGSLGPWQSTGNHVHDNDIWYRGAIGKSGAAADYNRDAFFAGNNRFNRNTYHVVAPETYRWHWGDGKFWSSFRAMGQEADGKVDTRRDAPLQPTIGAVAPLATPTPTRPPTPSPVPTASTTPTPTVAPKPTGTPKPSVTPKPTASATPTASPKASVSPKPTPTASPQADNRVVTILASGRPAKDVYPTVELHIAGVKVATFTDVRGEYQKGIRQSLVYTHTSPVDIASVRVVYVNDEKFSSAEDRNVYVDKVLIGQTAYETEDSTTYSTGTFGRNGCTPGYYKTGWLHCNGYFQYAK